MNIVFCQGEKEMETMKALKQEEKEKEEKEGTEKKDREEKVKKEKEGRPTQAALMEEQLPGNMPVDGVGYPCENPAAPPVAPPRPSRKRLARSRGETHGPAVAQKCL